MLVELDTSRTLRAAVLTMPFKNRDRNFQKEVGRRIADRRRELHRLYGRHTQIDAAEVLGVEREMISHYETGRHMINASDLVKLADWLRVPPAYLLGEIADEGFDHGRMQLLASYDSASESEKRAIRAAAAALISQDRRDA